MRWAVVLAVVGLAGCGSDGERRAPVEPGARAEEHLEALMALTARAGGDREASTDGERAAADYAAGVLRRAGFRVRRERVRFPFFDERRPARVSAAGEVRTLAYSPSGDVEARVAEVRGLGCGAGDYGAVRGAVALVARGVCPFATKARLAQRAGARAVVVADRGADEAVRGTLGRPGVVRIPAVNVGRAAGERLRGARRARVVTATRSETRTTANVIAQRGRARRVVMVGGHLDSVPGAPGGNDNASGLAASLAAAEGLAREGVPVRVGLWAAEELGLHGSRAHVRNLDMRERRAIRAYLNLDMVGSPRAQTRSYGPPAVREAVGIRRSTRMRGGSDHTPFARAGIAAGGIFTGASRRTDPCYHRRCDHLGNVDRRTLRRSARLATRALRRLAAG